MGRPKLPETRENITVRLKPSTVRELDRLAAKSGMDRARLMRNIIELEVGFLMKSEKVGLYTLGVLMRDAEEKVRVWVKGLPENPAELLESMT